MKKDNRNFKKDYNVIAPNLIVYESEILLIKFTIFAAWNFHQSY